MIKNNIYLYLSIKMCFSILTNGKNKFEGQNAFIKKLPITMTYLKKSITVKLHLRPVAPKFNNHFIHNLNINHHLFVDIRVTNYCTELFKADLAIFIFISKQDGFVYYLLKLCILEVIAYHHF